MGIYITYALLSTLSITVSVYAGLVPQLYSSAGCAIFLTSTGVSSGSSLGAILTKACKCSLI
jgi:hypothetical protein